MLAEFLLTPDAFCGQSGGSGSETVEKLARCLFPYVAAPVALLSQLGGEEWVSAVSSRIARLRDHKHRRDAQLLFTRIVDELTVRRPSVVGSGNTEKDWVARGKLSHADLQLAAIVVCEGSCKPDDIGVAIDDFLKEEFWDAYSNPRNVGRSTRDQEPVLRALAAHSEWLVIRLPQIWGGSDDEIVTAKQIIRQAVQVPKGYSRSEVELHLCMKDVEDGRLLRLVTGEVKDHITDCLGIRLVAWPKGHFINREILGGDFAVKSNGSKQRRSRWWVTMNHVAVGGRSSELGNSGANSWSLFSRKEAQARLAEIESSTPVRVEDL